MKRLVFIFLALTLLGLELTLAQTRIMFAGNSYTYYNDMPTIVKQIAKENLKEVEITMSVNGGVSLKDHWEANADLETKNLIEAQDYDWVVIQDQSLTPIRNPMSTLNYGKQLANLVMNRGGKVVIFQTWSRKNNPASQAQLDSTFNQLKDNTGAILAPVAEVWHLAKKEYPSLELYDVDGSHPSEMGSYLTALVFYLTLFDQDINTFKTISSKRWPLSEMKQCEWLALQIISQ